MEARVVGSEDTLKTNQLPNVLNKFNPTDGLTCLNSEQGFRKCFDYSVAFLCSNGEWSNWVNNDRPDTGTGDTEVPPTNCTNPTKAYAYVKYNDWRGGRLEATALALPDRLRQFNNNGLICENASQADGACSNYTTRFICHADVLKLENVWTGRALTVTYPLDANGNRVNSGGILYAKGQPYNPGWESQRWTIEPDGTDYVRLKNVWGNGNYLDVSTQTEGQALTTDSLVQGNQSQQWIMEQVAGTKFVRFKNRWTGRYLTMAENNDYSSVKAQTLNVDWLSQLWELK